MVNRLLNIFLAALMLCKLIQGIGRWGSKHLWIASSFLEMLDTQQP
jgi:hypothetical protein